MDTPLGLGHGELNTMNMQRMRIFRVKIPFFGPKREKLYKNGQRKLRALYTQYLWHFYDRAHALTGRCPRGSWARGHAPRPHGTGAAVGER